MAKPGRSAIASVTPGDPARMKFFVNVDAKGVALMGHDPVAFFNDKKPVMGRPELRTVYKGAIYQFASAANKAEFDKNPAQFEPQFGGFCGYAASIDKVSPISVEYFEILEGRLVLQHNQKAWDLWHKDVPGNLKKADANWPEIVERRGM
jgi:YHS domain-containing protein